MGEKLIMYDTVNQKWLITRLRMLVFWTWLGMHKQQDVLWLEEEAEITALAQISIIWLCKRRISQDLDIIHKVKYKEHAHR